MIIRIDFPNRDYEVFEIDIKEFNSIDDIAEYIAYELCRKNPVIKNIEKCAESHKRWILAQLWSKLSEEIGVI